jgi:hypothetical protein
VSCGRRACGFRSKSTLAAVARRRPSRIGHRARAEPSTLTSTGITEASTTPRLLREARVRDTAVEPGARGS